MMRFSFQAKYYKSGSIYANVRYLESNILTGFAALGLRAHGGSAFGGSRERCGGAQRRIVRHLHVGAACL